MMMMNSANSCVTDKHGGTLVEVEVLVEECVRCGYEVLHGQDDKENSLGRIAGGKLLRVRYEKKGKKKR